MRQYTKVLVLKITPIQSQTLSKLRQRNIRVAHFVREAIKEKIERDYQDLKPKPIKEYNPFD